MTTLTIMKARIADEMARGDIPDIISNAIASAIAYYQRQRFYFTETDSITFSTVAAQSQYTSSDHASIPYLYDVNMMTVSVSSNNYEVRKISPEEWRILHRTSTRGEPDSYCYWGQVIRLYPVPSDAWTIRIQAHVKLAAPATDGEADNKWMIDAEELIRSRAKFNIYREVLNDPAGAAMASAVEREALLSLNALSNSMAKTGFITPVQF